MRHVIALLILALGVSVTARAGDCSIFEKIGKAGLNENAAFWSDYAKLAEKGEPNAKDVEALMAKYKPEGVPPGTATSETSSASQTAARQSSYQTRNVELKKAAEKGYGKAPPQIQAKVDQLLQLYREKGSGFVQDLKANRSWNFESIGEQKGAFSVRLNDGYRATFAMDDDELKILDIGQHIYRH